MKRKMKSTNNLSKAHIILAVRLVLVITGAATVVQAADSNTADVKDAPGGQAMRWEKQQAKPISTALSQNLVEQAEPG